MAVIEQQRALADRAAAADGKRAGAGFRERHASAPILDRAGKGARLVVVAHVEHGRPGHAAGDRPAAAQTAYGGAVAGQVQGPVDGDARRAGGVGQGVVAADLSAPPASITVEPVNVLLLPVRTIVPEPSTVKASVPEPFWIARKRCSIGCC